MVSQVPSQRVQVKGILPEMEGQGAVPHPSNRINFLP